MSAWIGPLGNLIEFKCPSAVESNSEDPHVYFRPLGGSVSTTTLGDPTRPRVWNVAVSTARPDHVAALQALADGEWGPGPFVFIPPAGETLNLLGKRDALAMGTPGVGYVAERPGTAVPTTEGVAGASYGATGTAEPTFTALGHAPVIPGKPVTGKAWVVPRTGTTAKLHLRFYTAGHVFITGTADATTTNTAGAFLHITGTAPANAAYAILDAAGVTITRPQVTWTAGPRTWSPSAASRDVIMSPPSNGVRTATGRAGEEQLTDHDFTVTELTA